MRVVTGAVYMWCEECGDETLKCISVGENPLCDQEVNPKEPVWICAACIARAGEMIREVGK